MINIDYDTTTNKYKLSNVILLVFDMLDFQFTMEQRALCYSTITELDYPEFISIDVAEDVVSIITTVAGLEDVDGEVFAAEVRRTLLQEAFASLEGCTILSTKHTRIRECTDTPSLYIKLSDGRHIRLSANYQGYSPMAADEYTKILDFDLL